MKAGSRILGWPEMSKLDNCPTEDYCLISLHFTATHRWKLFVSFVVMCYQVASDLHLTSWMSDLQRVQSLIVQAQAVGTKGCGSRYWVNPPLVYVPYLVFFSCSLQLFPVQYHYFFQEGLPFCTKYDRLSFIILLLQWVQAWSDLAPICLFFLLFTVSIKIWPYVRQITIFPVGFLHYLTFRSIHSNWECNSVDDLCLGPQ